MGSLKFGRVQNVLNLGMLNSSHASGNKKTQKINFLIVQQKHMLWVLKETVLLSTQNKC